MSKSMNEIFSTNLRNALYMAGKTQAELAKAVGVTEVSVSKWINGQVVPRPKKVDDICRALRCSREDLMIDHAQKILIAPEDVLAEEMKLRPDLFVLFQNIMRLNDSDVKLVSDVVRRLL